MYQYVMSFFQTQARYHCSISFGKLHPETQDIWHALINKNTNTQTWQQQYNMSERIY